MIYKLLIGLLILALLMGCIPVDNKPIKNNTDVGFTNGSINNCAGYYISIKITDPNFPQNITKRELQYWQIGNMNFPINVSFTGSCNLGNKIPAKEYKYFYDFPLEDDCYNETRCWVKWEFEVKK